MPAPKNTITQVTAPAVSAEMTTAPARSAFRPDLEGLRAVAVILVVLYHAGLTALPGGYVGVDVFYVLSGFFITGLLWKQVAATGTIRFGQFYARRARRLLPTSALVLIVTAVVSWFVLAPLLLSGVGADVIAAGWNVANIRYALQATDYLNAGTAPSPVLHYWSLAVEEQFYLVWPALIFAAARTWGRGTLSTRTRKVRTAVVLSLVGAASLGASIVVTGSNQPYAFFMLPTRAWELAIGALLALAVTRLDRMPVRVRAFLGWAGIATIAVVTLVFTDATPFPGWTALVPVLGTAAIIASSGAAKGPAGFLTLAPMRAVGRWSFSLYLWHWPILILAAAAAGGALPLRVNLFLMLGALILAGATYRYFENPIRLNKTLAASTVKSLAFALVLTLGVTGIGAALLTRTVGGSHAGTVTAASSVTQLDAAIAAGLKSRAVPADLNPTLSDVKNAKTVTYGTGCMADTGDTAFPSCVFGDQAAKFTVWLIGDSHAAHWATGLDAAGKADHFKLIVHTRAACPIVTGDLRRDNGDPYPECAAWRTQVVAAVTAAHPNLIITTSSIGITGWRIPEYISGLAQLKGAADHVLVLGDSPRSDSDLATCVSAHLDDAAACAISLTSNQMTKYVEKAAQIKDGVAADGFDYVATQPWFCTDVACPVIVGNVLIYRDQSHLTPTASTWMLPHLRNLVAPYRAGAAN